MRSTKRVKTSWTILPRIAKRYNVQQSGFFFIWSKMCTEQEVRVQLLLAFFFVAALSYQDVEGIKENIHLCILFLHLFLLFLLFCISQRWVSKLEYAMSPLLLLVCLRVKRFPLRSLSMAGRMWKFSFPKATQQRVIVVEMARLFGWNLWIIKNLQFVFWSTEMVLVGLRKWTGWRCNLFLLALN